MYAKGFSKTLLATKKILKILSAFNTFGAKGVIFFLNSVSMSKMFKKIKYHYLDFLNFELEKASTENSSRN